MAELRDQSLVILGLSARMSSDVERLENLNAQLRQVRASMPVVIQKLATVKDDDSSVDLFRSIVHDLQEWQQRINEFSSNYAELKSLLDDLKQ